MSFQNLVFPLAGLLCLVPQVTSGIALLLGMSLSLIFENPYRDWIRKTTSRLLQISVVGLGAGMNLAVVGQVGLEGFGYTAIGIGLAVAAGLICGRIFQTQRNTSLLITVGTAICGGSAIAAVASTIRAKANEVSVALATIFFLNATALFLFPPIGHFFNLSEKQFGLWSALAIHDTSSVVGAALQYGTQAVEIATTVKLARALWIVPASLLIGLFWKGVDQGGVRAPANRPWFILWFVVAAAIFTWVPSVQPFGIFVSGIAKRTLVLTLFFIGSSLSKSTLQSVGLKPFLQGFCLWVLVASSTLGAIWIGWIR